MSATRDVKDLAVEVLQALGQQPPDWAEIHSKGQAIAEAAAEMDPRVLPECPFGEDCDERGTHDHSGVNRFRGWGDV